MSELLPIFRDWARNGRDEPLFDVVICGDGSGTKAHTPGGAYALIYRSEDEQLTEWWMASSHLSNNTAEVLPFVHALELVDRDPPQSFPGVIRVLCVSDSELTVKRGRGEYARGTDRLLWGALDFAQDQGLFRLSWLWIPRNSNPVHERADGESRRARNCFETFGLASKARFERLLEDATCATK